MVLDIEKKQKINKICNIVFPFFLFLYSLRHIRLGVGWLDTGYNFGNFAYVEHMDKMWLFSTYLSNILGGFMTKLPMGDTMLGLNLYTGLFISGLTVAGYFFFVKAVKLPTVFAFVGEFLAISLSWCPTALLYNYLSYALLGTGVVLLYFALMQGKRSNSCFVFAGIVLGVNVFVRFPNLANMALIVAVWAMGIIRKEKLIKVLKQTGLCVLGYVIGFAICFGSICLQYGADSYVNSIMRLLSMPSEASEYTPVAMVLSQVNNYIQNMKWIGCLLGLVLLGTIVYQILPRSWNWLKNTGYVFCVLCGFHVLMNRDMFNVSYDTYMSMFQWAVMLLTATLVIGVIVIFSKHFTQQEKLLCGLSMIVIVITPLGSNNHLYSAMNNLYFVLPFILWMLYRFFTWIPKEISVRKWKVSTYPFQAMLVCVAVMIWMQSTLFGWQFVFVDSTGAKGPKTSVENNDVLKGMLVEVDKAEAITEITEYVKEHSLKGKEVILYGQIPSLAYYLEMPFAISAWPDLPSYNYAVMEQDLQKIENALEEGKQLPVILLEKKAGTYVLSGENGVLEVGYNQAQADSLKADKKLQLLEEMIEEYAYQATFENDKFVLFQAGLEE